jgi:hypothetical protein
MDSAVVVADSSSQAIMLAKEAAHQYQTEDGSTLGFYNELIVVHKIGNNGKYGQRQKPIVCCLQIAGRHNLPPGNYTPMCK